MWRYNHPLKIVRRLLDVRDEQKVMINGLRDVNLMSLSYLSKSDSIGQMSTAKPKIDSYRANIRLALSNRASLKGEGRVLGVYLATAALSTDSGVRSLKKGITALML